LINFLITRQPENSEDNYSSNLITRGGLVDFDCFRSLLHNNNRYLIKEINYWLEEFEFPYKIKIDGKKNNSTEETGFITFIDKIRKVQVSPSNVGSGILQLLPLIVEGIVDSNNVIFVEHPEKALHPRIQLHISDFLIETSGVSTDKTEKKYQQKTKKQWILETHSELIMLRIQKRIRLGSLNNKDVSVIYVQSGPNGRSYITPLELSEEGDFIDEWPGGFFEETYNELFKS
jgi:hypothetical protein